MAQINKGPEMLARLEVILDEARQKWLEQPEGQRRPTLMLNAQGQVHVGHLLEKMGYHVEKNRQHFRKSELRSAVNAVCREQGVHGIGEDGPLASAEGAVKQVIKKQRTDNQRLAEQLVETQATIIQQQRRIVELEALLGLAQEDGVLLRRGPVRTGK